MPKSIKKADALKLIPPQFSIYLTTAIIRDLPDLITLEWLQTQPYFSIIKWKAPEVLDYFNEIESKPLPKPENIAKASDILNPTKPDKIEDIASLSDENAKEVVNVIKTIGNVVIPPKPEPMQFKEPSRVRFVKEHTGLLARSRHRKYNMKIIEDLHSER